MSTVARSCDPTRWNLPPLGQFPKQRAMSPVQDFHLREEWSWSDSSLDQVSLFGTLPHCANVIPEDKHIPLICDTGGGSYLHISPAFISQCLAGNLRPYILRHYLTRALCALDQEPHASMPRLWQGFKASWHGPLLEPDCHPHPKFQAKKEEVSQEEFHEPPEEEGSRFRVWKREWWSKFTT